jgi:hypothetical protein
MALQPLQACHRAYQSFIQEFNMPTQNDQISTPHITKLRNVEDESTGDAYIVYKINAARVRGVVEPGAVTLPDRAVKAPVFGVVAPIGDGEASVEAMLLKAAAAALAVAVAAVAAAVAAVAAPLAADMALWRSWAACEFPALPLKNPVGAEMD